MGMSTEMSPRYLTVSPSGQVAYILDNGNLGLAQVQLAVPATEVLLIQEEGKPISLPDSPILVADVAPDNLNLLGNNVIMLMSQAQELMIVNSDDIADSSSPQHWEEEEEEEIASSSPAFPEMMGQYALSITTEDTEDEWPSSLTRESSPNCTVEDARCWFRDSLISTAALSSLSTLIQSRDTTKED